MGWQTIAPGINEHFGFVRIGRKDDFLNPTGITYLGMDRSQLAGFGNCTSASPLLSGATFVLSAASLGVALDSNSRIRSIQKKLGQIEAELFSLGEVVKSVEKKIKAVHLKTEESHLRSALDHSIKTAFHKDTEIDLSPIADLVTDTAGFVEAMENPFLPLNLASDMRSKLSDLFRFLVGLRISSAHAANVLSGTGSIQFGWDERHFFPLHNPKLLILGATSYFQNVLTYARACEDLKGWSRENFSFHDEDDDAAIVSIFDQLSPTTYVDYVEAFAEVLSRIDLPSDGNFGSDEFVSICDSVLSNWKNSDSGLIFRIDQELKGLASGYLNFWPKSPLDVLLQSNSQKGGFGLLLSPIEGMNAGD